jgi:hypothetical protein
MSVHRTEDHRTTVWLGVRRAGVALAVAAALTGAGLAVSLLRDARPEKRPTAAVRDSDMTASEFADLNLTRRLPLGYKRACRRLAANAPGDVAACPPLVPAGPLEVQVAAPFSRTRRYREMYSMSFASCSLNSYRGQSIETNGCHWAYELGWSPRTGPVVVDRVVHGNNPANPRSACRWRSLAGQRVRACRVPPFEQGGGFHGGHVAYLWERASAAVVLSAHGYTNEARVRAMMTALIQTDVEP